MVFRSCLRRFGNKKRLTLDNKIVIENTGGLPLPVIVTCDFSDGTSSTYYKNVSVWQNGDNAVIIQADTSRTINMVTIGNNEIPDVITENNQVQINND